MITINYKRLFEIRILHDFFLSTSGGDSFFGLTDTAKEEHLERLLQSEQYNILRSLSIEPHPDTTNFLRNHKMRLLPSALGVVVALQVNTIDDAGDTLYEPFVSLDDEDELIFHLKITNPLFQNFTNIPWWEDRLPTTFLLSNESARNVGGAKVLSRPVAPLGTFPDYLMGDLVEDGGAIKEVFYPLNSNVQSLLAVDSDGFVNLTDRRLLPKAFYFDFKTEITDAAEFSFFDSGNNLIKVIQQPAGTPYRFVKLDLTKTDGSNPPVLIADGDYRLEVSTTGGFMGIYEMTFSDRLFSPNAIGAVRMSIKTGNPAFDLLDGNGRLHARALAGGAKVGHPVFEVRFLSRRTYWRYQQEGGFVAPNPSPDYLDLMGDRLVSKSPRPLTESLTYFEETGFSRQYLPNARPAPLKFEEKKIFSEIYISPVNRLIV